MLYTKCNGFNLLYCPECGGELKYTSTTRGYVCKSCGLSMTHQEFMELRDKIRPDFESEDEKRKKERREYLKWWLGKKK